MSLQSTKSQLRQALLDIANNTNAEQTKEEAVDSFLNALEDWLNNATVEVPATGLNAPNGPVTGTAFGTLS